MSAQSRLPSRAGLARRALVGAAWALAWTLAWGGALAMFARRAEAAPAPAVSWRPVSLPIDVARARGFFDPAAWPTPERRGADVERVLRAIDPAPLRRIDAMAVGRVR